MLSEDENRDIPKQLYSPIKGDIDMKAERNEIAEMKSVKVVYRYIDIMVDYFAEKEEDSIIIKLLKCPILKETKYGYQIHVPFKGKRFMRKNAHKQFACLTKEEALRSFIARKKQEIKHYRNKMDRAILARKKGIEMEKGEKAVEDKEYWISKQY